MTVMDLTASGRKSALILEAEKRGCNVVSPRQLLRAQLAQQLQVITGKQVAADLLERSLNSVIEEDV